MKLNLSHREYFIIFIAAFFAAMFFGLTLAVCAANLTGFWEGLAATSSALSLITTIAAVVLAVRGYQHSQTLHHDEFRPWLGLDTPERQEFPVGPFRIVFNLINHGRHPANNVVVRHRSILIDPETFPQLKPDSSLWVAAKWADAGRLVSFPGHTNTINANLWNIGHEDLAAIEREIVTLVIEFQIDYSIGGNRSGFTQQTFCIDRQALYENKVYSVRDGNRAL